MADYIAWRNLIERGCRDDFGMTFLKGFKSHIPAASFKDSGPWYAIIEEKESEIEKEIAQG